MSSLCRRVASRWAFQYAMQGWKPPIPPTLLESLKVGYASGLEADVAFNNARESINVFLPKLLAMLRQKQGETYYMNASVSRGKLFYYFAPRHPIDSFALTLYMTLGGNKAHIAFSYLPLKLNGEPDFSNVTDERATMEPDLAGIHLMRIVRKLLGRI